MNLERKYFLHPFNIIRNKFYAELFRSKYYKNLLQKDLKKALGLQYKAGHKEKIDWENPQTLDAKIMWLEIMTDTTLWSQLTDKYEVRKYIEKKGYSNNLVKCYGVWDNVDEIDYKSLPNKFVIKCTHDSGSTFIINDKLSTDLEKIKNELRNKLKPMGTATCEPHYLKIKPRIIVEELLEDTEQKKLSSSLIDYKIWCFNGTPYIAFVCYDRHRKADGNIGVTYDLFSLDTWEHKGDFLSKKDANYKKIPKPQCLQEMLQIAKKLSEDFPLVRVDFYIINNKPYFGELTFTSAGGLNYFYSELGQITMGKAINLSNVKRIR